MSSQDFQPARMTKLRRSQRACLSIPVIVIKTERGATAASEETHTVVVSAHGALLLLHMAVKPGDLITLKHKKTMEELSCRVITLGLEHSGTREIGVEFEHPAPRFWHIAFPPNDWTPHGPDAKPPTPQVPGNRPPQVKLTAPSGSTEKQIASKI